MLQIKKQDYWRFIFQLGNLSVHLVLAWWPLPFTWLVFPYIYEAGEIVDKLVEKRATFQVKKSEF